MADKVLEEHDAAADAHGAEERRVLQTQWSEAHSTYQFELHSQNMTSCSLGNTAGNGSHLIHRWGWKPPYNPLGTEAAVYTGNVARKLAVLRRKGSMPATGP